jgi:hypothetical protein
MACDRVRPDDEPDPILTEQELTEARRHWAELAREDGWEPAALCHCLEPDLIPLGGGDGYYLVNMCDRCKRKVLVPPPRALQA